MPSMLKGGGAVEAAQNASVCESPVLQRYIFNDKKIIIKTDKLSTNSFLFRFALSST